MVRFRKNKEDLALDSKKLNLMDYFVKDIFEVRHPQHYKKPAQKEFEIFKKNYLDKNKGIWVYYPWLKTAYKIPKEDDYFEILTARNKPYISEEEQKNFYHFNVGIVGLSVGQSSALTIVRGGGARNIKIADPDTIEPSNLNRLNSAISSIGKKKTEESAQKMLEINPFLNIKSYDKGLTEKNEVDFFVKDFKLDVIVDACDSFPAKILIRKLAAQFRIPVIMTTDVGDGSLIDIERYDINPKTTPFGGRLEKIKDPDDFLKAAVTIISPEHIPLTLQDRFFEIGKTTPTHPQLANSVYFGGTIVSYLIRCLANKKEIVDERIFIDYDEIFDPKYKDKNFKKFKQQKIDAFKKMLGLE
jgi:hypothetical protein